MVDILNPDTAPEDDLPVLEGEVVRLARGAADDQVTVIPEGDGNDEDALPAHAEPLEDGRVRLPLLYADRAVITYRKGREGEVQREPFAELTFRRLNGADMRAIASAGKGADPAIVAIARSTGIHLPKMHLLYDAMDAADVTAASQVVTHFLSSGPTTGR